MPYCLFTTTPSHGYFGAFPTQEEVGELYELGVRVYVNLTEIGEDGIGTYEVPEDCARIHYPIPDKREPSDWETFAKFILKLCARMRAGESIFVHCRAGHGRSSTVCTSILCQLDLTLHPETAIAQVSEAHAKRAGLNLKWKRMMNPLSRIQQIFIYKFFATIYVNKAYQTGVYTGFSSVTLHPVEIAGIKFPTAESAYQYHIDPDDPVYKNKLLDPKKFAFIKLVGDDHWSDRVKRTDFDKQQVMFNVCWLKYTQNPELQKYLKRTYLQRIWDGYKYSHANNLVGNALMKVREALLTAE